jgi:DNA modification methylase
MESGIEPTMSQAGIDQAKYEIRNIADLTNWEDNPRTITEKEFERLQEQIRLLGVYKPLLINQNNIVLGGNMRLRALKDLGVGEVMCAVVLTDNTHQMIEYALSDNDAVGTTDEEKLAELVTLHPIEQPELFAVQTGKLKSVETLLRELGPEAQEDEPPEVSQEPAISLLGEAYQLGRHRVMCGDSTDENNVKNLMAGKKADVVITDPPYNFSDKGAGYFAKQRENVNERIADMVDFDPHSIGYLKEGNYATSYYFFTNKTLLTDYLNLFDGLGNNLLVWEKSDAPPMVNNNFLPNIEYILYFYEPSRIWNNGLDIDTYRKVYRSSMNEGRNEGNDAHPTIKPVTLLSKFIKISSKDSVLDLFLGSGSTLIACEQTDRTCYGMELDPKYVDVIRKRYAKFVSPDNEIPENWQELTPLL